MSDPVPSQQQEPLPTMVKVSLSYQNVALLAGLSDRYADQFLNNLKTRLYNGMPREEAAEVTFTAVEFTMAKLSFDKILGMMLDEGQIRVAAGDLAPYDVLFTDFEHKFLKGIIETGHIDKSKVDFNKFSEEDFQKAEALVAETLARLNAGVVMTVEEIKALQAAQQVQKDPSVPAFTTNKVGLA